MKTAIMTKCEELLKEGQDIKSIIYFLEDGEALLQFGFTDDDQEDIECALDHFNNLSK
jgi:hypothetical protein